MIKLTNIHYAAATIMTTVIGVGIFGIPFSFAKAGFVTGLIFLFGIAVISLLINLMYGEIVLRTAGQHQIIGHAGKYLGSFARYIMFFAFIFGIYGAMTATIAISGTFWANVLYFIDSSPYMFSILFFAVAAVVYLKGLKTVSRVDFAVILFFTVVILIIAIFGAGSIDLNNFSTVFMKEFWFLPFGVILFSFAGMSSIPLAKEITKGRENDLKKAIWWGSIVPAVLYLVFSLTVFGISGEVTSPDAISGLSSFLGPVIIFVGALLGSFSTFTVFINTSIALGESFEYDLGMSRRKSQLLVLLPPFVLFLIGIRDFIEIIGLVGSISVGLTGVITILIYLKAKQKGDRQPEYSLNLPNWLLYLLVAIFGGGIMYSFVFF